MSPYTYVIRSEDGTPIYVGKGSGSRCGSHLKRSDVRQAAGAKLTIEVEFHSSDDDAFAAERELIAELSNPEMLNVVRPRIRGCSVNMLNKACAYYPAMASWFREHPYAVELYLSEGFVRRWHEINGIPFAAR